MSYRGKIWYIRCSVSYSIVTYLSTDIKLKNKSWITRMGKGMEGWKWGRGKGWKVGRLEGWKDGRLEVGKNGRGKGWKVGRLEGWKVGSGEGGY